MKILSVNAGSSSLKFTLFEMPEEKVLISGVFERIGISDSFYTIKLNGEKIKKEVNLENHKDAFQYLVQELLENKIIDSLRDIKGIGNRIVQGGSYFDRSVIATESVISKIDELSVLGPLHNPPAIVGIRAEQEVFKDAILTTVFDTALFKLSKVSSKFSFKGIYLITIPISLSSSNQGRILDACSDFESNTSSPFCKLYFIKPNTIIFKLSVVPFVNTISLVLSAFIKFLTFSLTPSYSLSTIKLIS